MVNNIDEAVLFLKRNLKLSYEIKEIRRKNILEIPEDALREVVIYAACHRSYFEKAHALWLKYLTTVWKLPIRGGLPKGITSENFGTINAMTAAGLEKPVFNTQGFFKVTFKRDMNVGKVGKDVGKENEMTGSIFSDMEAKAYKIIKENNTITISELSQSLNVTERQVQRIIKKLRDKMMIKRKGGRKQGYWEV